MNPLTPPNSPRQRRNSGSQQPNNSTNQQTLVNAPVNPIPRGPSHPIRGQEVYGQRVFGQYAIMLPPELTRYILQFLTAEDRRALSAVSTGSRDVVRSVRDFVARKRLKYAIQHRYAAKEIILKKRNGATKISADRIIDNIYEVVRSPSNCAFVIEQLMASLHTWPRIKLFGKKGQDRDGLKPALAKLVTAATEAEVKGAIGEIQDAMFFSQFAQVAMDQTKEYTDLIHGQYLDTEKSKQMDVVYAQSGFTHYVETKFDVDTAIHKHSPVTKKQELEERAKRVRQKLGLGDKAPVKTSDHPLKVNVSQQLLGYEAAAEHRVKTKGKKVICIVSIPNSRGWIKLFTATPSTGGLYAQLGWHLRIGSLILSPDDMKRIQARVFTEALGNPNPSYRERNHPTNRPKLEDYALTNGNVTPEDFLKGCK